MFFVRWTFGTAGAVLALCVACAALAADNPAEAIRNHIARGEFDKAIALSDRLIRSEPAREQAAFYYNARGFSYHMKGQYDRAITDYDEAIKRDPKGAMYSNRGNAWLEKGEYARSLADHDRAIRLMTGDAAGYLNRARTFRAKGDYDRALADYDQAIKLEPKFVNPYVGRGLTWRLKGDLDRALAEYDRALRIDPKNVGALASRGQAWEEKGNLAKAQADYQAAVDVPAKLRSGQGPASEMRVNIEVSRYRNMARMRLRVLSDAGSENRAGRSAAAGTPPPESSAAKPSRRIALVIGNGAYGHTGALRNPPNDARAVSTALRALGFETLEGLNLDRVGLERTVREFLLRSSDARMAVVFYAGHGVQIDGRNYLVPVDASFERTTEIATELAEVGNIIAGLDDPIRTTLVILDACRDNPLGAREAPTVAARSVSIRSGLAAPAATGRGGTAGAGTLIAFATAPGQVALDGEGDNSPFSTALVRHVGTPGLEVQQMLTRVRAEVVAATKSKQVPWSNSSLLGEVYLAGQP